MTSRYRLGLVYVAALLAVTAAVQVVGGQWAVTVGVAGAAVVALRPPEAAHVAVRLPFDRSPRLRLA